MSDLRVLMPQRFDVLSRAMDTSIVAQWQFLGEAVDLVLWGPGLDGFDAGRALDRVAADVDADVILLPDLHHGIPGLWDALWAGAERAPCPVVWHLVDQGSALAARRAVWERIRPAAVLLSYTSARLGDYADLLERLDTRTLSVPWGFDHVLFTHAGAGERDIDLLIAGASEPEAVYAVRGRIQRAARTLADTWKVVDLGHPGYWESGQLAPGRGQAQFADLLRRTRLATTGSAFGSLPRKYWESAACGAVGVGDLPGDEPDADRFAGCTLVVDPAWSEARIAGEIDALLRDPGRLATLAAAGPAAMAGCDHRERAHAYAAALQTVVARPRRARRPRPFPAAAPARLVIAAPEPDAVPTSRADWHDVWRAAADDASRTRRLEAVLAGGDEDVCVIALDPDAARHVDALVLASACRATGQVVVRPAVDAPSLALAAWALVAAPRAALLAELASRRGRCGPEEAVVALAERLGVDVGVGGAFADPAADLARLYAVAQAPVPAAADAVLGQLVAAQQRALREGRLTTAGELAGMARVCWRQHLHLVPRDPGDAVRPQDPELDAALLPGAAFAVYDPTAPGSALPIAAHAVLGPQAPPLQIGVPVAAGCLPTETLDVLAAALELAGVDLDASADLVVLERPLWEGEIAWLAARCPSPSRDAAHRPMTGEKVVGAAR